MYLRRLLVFLGFLLAASLLFLAILPQKQRFMNAIGNAVRYQDSPLLNSIHTAWVREYYARQAPERIALLNNMRNPLNFASIYNVIVPEARCPDLVRVGRVSDGGKYVCNPKAFPTGNCSIYSFGLNNEVSFDVEIQQMTGCQLYGYDSVSSQRRPYNAIYETGEALCLGKCDSRGVGSVLFNTSLAMNINSFEQPTTQIERVRLKRRGSIPVLIIIFFVCASTSSYDEEEVEAFYMDLEKFYRVSMYPSRSLSEILTLRLDPEERLKNVTLGPTV
ncbi:unnamed protein product [Angiostrongylus costaricensis]|uniref:Methyltranfer_dom domain-containing protein n=1 Tax=Angiostrongylus costaricensis TaxID=334426 RepID=A0A0R3PHG5_ANGCS|nr:unnamed protein product [Angiostrongylus costaricensis]